MLALLVACSNPPPVPPPATPPPPAAAAPLPQVSAGVMQVDVDGGAVDQQRVREAVIGVVATRAKDLATCPIPADGTVVSFKVAGGHARDVTLGEGASPEAARCVSDAIGAWAFQDGMAARVRFPVDLQPPDDEK
jgi:hypothetical protein